VEAWSGGLDGPSDGGLMADDEVSGGGEVSAELDIDGSVLDAIEGELADVERALALLDEGTYGRCEHCGAVIDDDVLARTPTARFCAQHLPLALR
jgi:RNA polymerase-binding transcription factor